MAVETERERERERERETDRDRERQREKQITKKTLARAGGVVDHANIFPLIQFEHRKMWFILCRHGPMHLLRLGFRRSWTSTG